jgi:hypothetical protein
METKDTAFRHSRGGRRPITAASSTPPLPKAAETVAEPKIIQDNSETTLLDLGRSIGQGQALSFVASKCSSAQAECLQNIREQKHYDALGLTWEEFCRRHLGISRSYADQLIRNLQEFGATYFRLSKMLHISEAAYREIADVVTIDAIEIDGENIPIVPENAARIRKSVAQLRSDLHKARTNRPSGSIISLQSRLDICFQEMTGIARVSLDSGEQAGLRALVEYSRRKLQLIPLPPQ